MRMETKGWGSVVAPVQIGCIGLLHHVDHLVQHHAGDRLTDETTDHGRGLGDVFRQRESGLQRLNRVVIFAFGDLFPSSRSHYATERPRLLDFRQ